MQDEPRVTAMAEQLAKAKGKDQVSLVLLPEGKATTLRIEAQEGVLQLIGTAVRQSGGLPGLAQ